MENMTINSIELRKVIRAKYAWPGGHEMFGICGDGGVLCCDCMKKEYFQIAHSRNHDIRDGWNVEAVDCAANYDTLVACDHCSKVLVEETQS